VNKFYIKAFLLILVISCSEQQNAQIEIFDAFPDLSFTQPVDIQTPGDGSNRLFVVSQPGQIFVFDNSSSVSEAEVFLDIRSSVLSGGEQGLLGIAFHPDYSGNGYFYVDYTASNPRRTVISRFQVSAGDPYKADLSSELVMLEVGQPYANHNGGQLMFGPDGYLYVSFGDGGSGGDPQNNGQNLSTLLGSIIRIDVDNPGDGRNYSIPADNPFIGMAGAKEEIYAYGLRNVWRFSFDASGKLWAADVGQNAWEEINIIEKGGNYGWRIMEATHCYNPSSGCDETGFIMPVHEYGHNSSGGYSITGGYVYNGSEAPEYAGKYIYGDFASGNIWALEYNGSVQSNELVLSTSYSISTFGVDESGEIYFADYSSGKIYKFSSGATSASSELVSNFDFRLEQNYPNPFNPETTIEYSIPEGVNSEKSKVNLAIYDILGRLVAILVNEEHAQGRYNVTFDAGNISSGIYYYRLSSGSYSEIRKMILLK
jgi:glucose/arabinose dehydrogenase